ncbi:hypothetical protein GLW08_20290, partial [Pontibacillus yanchengensis]
MELVRCEGEGIVQVLSYKRYGKKKIYQVLTQYGEVLSIEDLSLNIIPQFELQNHYYKLRNKKIIPLRECKAV